VTCVQGGRIRSRIGDTPKVPDLSCTIVVSGELGDRFDGVFADLALTHDAGTTRLSGGLADQAELQGVLSQLFGLGLEIVSVSTHPGEMPGG